jgi:MoaA/NifB/PqqE/SkfB family radical SAM enzyme
MNDDTEYVIRNTPFVVVWRVTEHCDLACHFCGYSRRVPRARTLMEPEPGLAFGAVLGEYAREAQRQVLVSWLGGEPLRWPPVFDVSDVFKREFGLRVGATTNGTALASAEVRRRLIENFDQLTISIDGLGALHDTYRSASGLYARLRLHVVELRELKAQAGHGPRLRVNTVLMRENIHALEKFCRAMAGWGFEELTFNALGGRERPDFYRRHCLLPEHVDWLKRELPGLRARVAPLGLAVHGSERYLSRLAASAHDEHLPIADCSPGQQFLFVDEHGFIAPCSFTLREYGVHVSEIRSAADLRRLPATLAERRRQRPAPVCGDCPSTQVFGKFARAALDNPMAAARYEMAL